MTSTENLVCTRPCVPDVFLSTPEPLPRAKVAVGGMGLAPLGGDAEAEMLALVLGETVPGPPTPVTISSSVGGKEPGLIRGCNSIIHFQECKRVRRRSWPSPGI